jgi:hypothetical protein
VITLKEEFVGCTKIMRAIDAGGWQVLGMWLALKRYAAENPDTDGFIPDDEIERLPGAPPKARKLLQALVECGKVGRGGARGAGLVDPAEHGWELHDYEDHALTVEVEIRKEKARERKRRWRAEKEKELEALRAGHVTQEERDSHAGQEGTETGQSREASPAGGGAPARTHTRVRPSPAQPSPASRGEDPHTPKPTDPLADQLHGKAPHQRADVLRVHAEFKRVFGLTGHKFRGYGDLDAVAVAEAIDLHGEPTCMRVLEFAPRDGMVSGRDDEKRVKHESLRYIFGNAQAFARILRSADEAQSQTGESTVSRIARLRDADPEVA